MNGRKAPSPVVYCLTITREDVRRLAQEIEPVLVESEDFWNRLEYTLVNHSSCLSWAEVAVRGALRELL